jgi:molybdopterin/thiamine biosynthesis adenylyltransferase
MPGQGRGTVRRPRVKPEHAPYRISGGRIRIGGESYGIAAEISDPAGLVWTVLTSMDGSRSTEEVLGCVVRSHPLESPDRVRAVISELISLGFVEDAGAADPAELTERDKQRYARARGYYRWLDLTPRATSWEPQARLQASSVTVIGMGGTGGVASLALAAAGVGRLHCVDPDVVELSNLCRQVIYTEDDIGQPKAGAAVARLRRLNADIEVSGEQSRVASADDVLRLAGGCDVLLLAADQPSDVRVWVNRACIAAGRPWVDSGYHGPVVQVGVYQPGSGACWECLHDTSLERRLALGAHLPDIEHRSAAVAHAVGSVPAGISGYLAAHQVISLLTGVPPVVPGTIHAINLAALEAPAVFTAPPRPACPACSARQAAG